MEYFMAVWYNLRQFGIVYGHLLYFSQFGMDVWTKKNLATLVRASVQFGAFRKTCKTLLKFNSQFLCYRRNTLAREALLLREPGQIFAFSTFTFVHQKITRKSETILKSNKARTSVPYPNINKSAA
jgi:hypothetical protein